MRTEFGTGNLSLQIPDLSTVSKVHLLHERGSQNAGIPVGMKSVRGVLPSQQTA